MNFVSRTPRAGLVTMPMLWLIALVVTLIVSTAIRMILVTPVADSGSGAGLGDTFYVVSRSHYGISLAAAFVLYSGAYLALDRVFHLRYRPIFAHTHLWLTFLGTILIELTPAGIVFGGRPHRFIDPVQAFQFWSTASEAGYGLTLAGLATFVILLVDAARTARLGKPSAPG